MTRTDTINPRAPNREQLKTYVARFFDLFTPSVELIEQLIAARSNAQEIILLACARLDALGSTIAS